MNYRFNFRWTALLGIVSFGILVPTIFIPELKLFTRDHSWTILISIIITFIIWEGVRVIQSIIQDKLPWEQSIAKHLVYEILSIALYTATVLSIGLLIYNSIITSINVGVKILLSNLFVAFTLALLFTAINEGSFLFKKWKTSLVEQERLRKETAEAKLESLKKQIDPHFLFNSLSVLSGLIYKDPEMSDKFIQKLSKVYRYVLENKVSTLVTVKEELEFLENYYFLIKVRFGEGIILNNNLPKNVYQKSIATLSLQLLLENAMKHNITSVEKPLTVDMFYKEGYIYMENKLQLRSTQIDSTHLGLKNLKSRYHLLNNSELLVKESNDIFSVGIPIITE